LLLYSQGRNTKSISVMVSSGLKFLIRNPFRVQSMASESSKANKVCIRDLQTDNSSPKIKGKEEIVVRI